MERILINYSREERKFLKYLQYADVVSFDIFDTLLIRPYAKPVDMFKHMEKIFSTLDFSKEREFAEFRARKAGITNEISFNDIYDCILDEYTYLKEKELDFERKCLRANPVIERLYNLAIEAGKRVIAVSDMYLPEDFLREVLVKNGYEKVEKIYVSSEYKVDKNSKLLYEKVIEDLKIKPEKFLHVGDNLTCDFYRPKECGMNALFIPKIIENRNVWSKRAEKISGADADILRAMFAYKNVKYSSDNYWNEIGYYLGGPLAVGYIEKIRQVSKRNGIESLLFVSRDGYILQRVYNILEDNSLENKYVYAPRILNLKCFLDSRETPDYLSDIEDLKQGCRQDIEAFAAKKREDYANYLRRLDIKGNKIALIDMTTGAYSSLYFLKRFLSEKLALGFYSCAFSHNTTLKAYIYLDKLLEKDDLPLVNLTEFLITAPEAPLIDIDGENFIFKELNCYDKQRIDVYNQVMEGIEEFASDYKVFFGKYPAAFSSETVFALLKEFIKSTDLRDRKYLKQIYHAKDTRSLVYKSLYDGMGRYSYFKNELKNFYLRKRHDYVEFKRYIKHKIKCFLYENTKIRFRQKRGR